MKRFWTMATTDRTETGYRVLLDGKPVRLPGGAPLLVTAPALAAAIAAEWQAAGGAPGGEMTPADIPLTRLAGTAQEKLAEHPAAMVAGLAKYAETDLLCYRAEDPRLAAREAAAFQPLLDWASRALDAPLRTTTGLMPIAQPPDALAALHRATAAHDAMELIVLGLLVPAFGSLVLALAVLHGEISAAEAHRLSILGETFQEEVWGTDAEAAARREKVAAEVALAARFLGLVRAGA